MFRVESFEMVVVVVPTAVAMKVILPLHDFRAFGLARQFVYLFRVYHQ